VDVRQAFEFPPPTLSLGADEVIIDTKGEPEALFTIRNAGGGTLAGRIVSSARCVVFTPAEWEGNHLEVRCRYEPRGEAGIQPDDLEAEAQILSNGGEARLPVTVRMSRMSVETPEGMTLSNVADFYAYAKQYHAQARKLFFAPEFHMLLLASGYPYVDAFELLLKDPSRARALDNFFIISGLKGKTDIELPREPVEHTRAPGDDNMVYGNFAVTRSDGGYYEAAISAESGAEWLSLAKERLFAADFDENNKALIKYSINPLNIKGRYARETIRVGDKTLQIVFRRPQPLRISLPREGYRFSDTGVIVVENAGGAEAVLEVFCKESFVRFEQRRYTAGAFCEIPFVIRLSALQSAQLLFRKQPCVTATIEVKAAVADTVVRKHLSLIAGEW
jgi:hypothetical protein